MGISELDKLSKSKGAGAIETVEAPKVEPKAERPKDDQYSTQGKSFAAEGLPTGQAGGGVASLLATVGKSERTPHPDAPRVELEYHDDKSNKRYAIEVLDKTLVISFGKIGTEGQTQEKTFPTAEDAVKTYKKKLSEKEKEGYVRLGAEKPGALDSLDAWKKLGADRREQILDEMEYFADKHPTLSKVEDVEIGKLTDPKHKAFAEKMRSFMEENCYMDLDNEEHVIIGQPEVTVSLYTLKDTGDVVGGTIRYWQKGGDNEDYTYGHYDTREEAIAAGVDVDTDVSWAAHGLFDHDGKPANERYDTYLEWTGY
jgi:predicted DNA-binding WGR domain protein